MATEIADPRENPDPAFELESHPGRHNGLILMIVGGAGLLTGLIADKDVLTIAGAGLTGIGLYLYLR